MRIVDQPVDKSESSAGQTSNQPVTPVSFASITQVRMDIAVTSPVGHCLQLSLSNKLSSNKSVVRKITPQCTVIKK